MQVLVQFSPPKAVPGEKSSLQLSAQPGSLCGLSAVDQSVLILEPGKRLDAQKVTIATFQINSDIIHFTQCVCACVCVDRVSDFFCGRLWVTAWSDFFCGYIAKCHSLKCVGVWLDISFPLGFWHATVNELVCELWCWGSSGVSESETSAIFYALLPWPTLRHWCLCCFQGKKNKPLQTE